MKQIYTLNDNIITLYNSIISKTLNPFISYWKTDNDGISNSNQITLPLYSGGSYNFTIHWGDNLTSKITSWNQSEVTHTYSSIGTYEVKITGTLIGWRFNYEGDYLKIIDISNWGILNVGNLGSQFYGCSNMTCTATDIMDTSNITNMSVMFGGCSLFNQNLNNWNVSNVTNMYYMFGDCYAFNGNISDWNVSKVTDMSWMFYSCSEFNQDLNNWNVSEVKNMSVMFNSCYVFNGNISNWNVSKVTNMQNMFTECQNFNSDITSWIVTNVIDMNRIFNNCLLFDQNLSIWNIVNVEDMTLMFDNCSLSIENYSNILIGWSLLTVKHNVPLGASTKYNSTAISARATLTNSPNNWIITDDGIL